MKKYENTTIENQAFTVEECVFVNCILRNCDLYYRGGPFQWANTSFENCRWNFQAGALYTIQLMQTLGMWKAQEKAPPNVSNSTASWN